MVTQQILSRRNVIRLGILGATAPPMLALGEPAGARQACPDRGLGRAKSCIVLFSWGGTSHVDTWDVKPQSERDVRGEFQAIATTVPGIQLCEHMPGLAKQAHHLAIVRSMHHTATDHRAAGCLALTGHRPSDPDGSSRLSLWNDWPSLGSMISYATAQERCTRRDALPGAATLPCPLAFRGPLGGQGAGFLAVRHAPKFYRPQYAAERRTSDFPPLDSASSRAAVVVDADRQAGRLALLRDLEALRAKRSWQTTIAQHDRCIQRAPHPAAASAPHPAFDLEAEPPSVRDAYGDHLCGQSVLLARRLTEAGVPLVTVNCGVSDLAIAKDGHWDTHADNFNRLRRDMLPPWDRAGAALLADLADRGRLDETLVVWLTEFGRTPKINSAAGRDHHPHCYSVALAGGGIQGGQIYGRSCPHGIEPTDSACRVEDLQATIFHALGIQPDSTIHDSSGREYPLTRGHVLPLFS